MKIYVLSGLIAFAPLAMSSLRAATPAHTFAIGDTDFLLDGKPFQIRSGEIHYPRTPHEYWRDRLKKAKAMGLDAICTYIFWNRHEPEPGVWDFSGDNDVAQFCRIAQEEGLFVILRPGPYVCGEWDFGGYPAWLLRDRNTKVRTRDPKFMEAAHKYILKIGEQLKDLQVTRGGPILMVQVENEYGSFGDDMEYKKAFESWTREAGFDVPLFTSDGPSQGQLHAGSLPGVTATINFGGGAEKAFAELKKFRGATPRMNGEFWVGWFDAWGRTHATRSAAEKAGDYEWMIANGVSVNCYMFHGGTNFAFYAGANGNRRNDFTPDITSYDYSAILDEAGRPTEKFFVFRDILKKHFPAETFPPLPARKPMQTIAPFAITGQAAFSDLFGAPARGDEPKTMEELGQNYGFTYYETTVTGPVAGPLDLGRTRDRAIVTLDGVPVATLDRRVNRHVAPITVPAGTHRLGILVEQQARINFGRDMIPESKGLVVTPKLAGKELKGWDMYPVPCDNLEKLKFGPIDPAAKGPRFYRASFTTTDDGDTYLDMSRWTKGLVWVNGHNLGRFWNIGPQQALYLPGCWVKKGANEVVVLSLETQRDPTLSGIADQIWETRVDPSLYLRKPGQHLAPDDGAIAHTGRFAPGDDWQTATFAKPAKGRYLAFDALNSLDGQPFAAMTEIIFVDAQGRDVPREQCSVVYADSEELAKENGSGSLVLDNQPTTWWHTAWSGAEKPGFPHALVFDLGAGREIAGFRYRPRQGSASGRIGDYRIRMKDTPFKGL